MTDTAYLVLEDGTMFRGRPLGARGEALCEIVFATGMVGYIETLTDKNYWGQGVVQTFPVIGNYGVMPADQESERAWLSAYIVRECCERPSNFRSEGALSEWLVNHNVVGVQGIDTRALTRRIRERGVMNGIITEDPGSCDMERMRNYRVQNAVSAVSVKTQIGYAGAKNGPSVAIIDCGCRESIVRSIVGLGCNVRLLPHDTSAKDILATAPDGILISNGPGDPAENRELIEEIKALRASGVPMLGICLGHQLLALAEGFRTEKMKFGHRGQNQPVRRAADGRVFITSQNHGYAVLPESLDADRAEPLFVNVNDGGCEGLNYKDGRAFSVQFQPDTDAGETGTRFVLDEFMKRMEVYRNAAES